jgi:hypothetical protein
MKCSAYLVLRHAVLLVLLFLINGLSFSLARLSRMTLSNAPN